MIFTTVFFSRSHACTCVFLPAALFSHTAWATAKRADSRLPVPLRQSERTHAHARCRRPGRAGWPREPRHADAVVSLPGARPAPPLPLPLVRLAAARVQGRQGAARFSLELALRWPPCHVSAALRETGLGCALCVGDCDRPGAPSRFNAAASRKAEPRPVAEQRRVTEPLACRWWPVVLAPLRAGGGGSGRGCSSSYRDRWLDLKWLSAAADFSSKAVTAANFDGSRGGVGWGGRSTVTCTGSTLGLTVLYFAVSIGRGPGRCGKAAFTSVKLPRLDFTRSIFFDGVGLITKFLYRPNIPTGFSDGF